MHTAQNPAITYLPLTAYVAASPASAPADDDGLWEVSYGVPTASLRGDTLLMQVVGNSLDDGSPRSIAHGSIVLVDRRDMEHHQMRRLYPYVFVTPEGAVVAKIYGMHKGKPALLSLNPGFPPIEDFRRAGYQPVGLLYAVRESVTAVKGISEFFFR